MVFQLLKDRLNPQPDITVFVLDKTTPELKNQILGIIHDYYKNGRIFVGFDISDYSGKVMTKWSTAKCKKPLQPGYCYSEDALYNELEELNDYEFFELLDCMIQILFSDPNVQFNPSFVELMADIDESLLKHGINYTIIDGKLVIRTEEVIIESSIKPCLVCLGRYRLFDADAYLKEAFEKYKSNNCNEAIEYAVKSLENVVQKIIDNNRVDCDPKKKLHEKISILMKECGCGFLCDKMNDQYLQMEKIFQVAVSSRNEGSHGAKPFVADGILVEHTINIVCSDILFLARSFYEKK